MKTKYTSDTVSCLHGLLLPSQNPETIDTDNSKTCLDLRWNHDTSTPHRSETNGVTERAVRRVQEGTAIAPVQSGLPEELVGQYDGVLTTRWPMSRQHSRKDVVKVVTDHLFPSEHWLNTSRLLQKTSQTSISLVRKRREEYSWAVYYRRLVRRFIGSR